MNQGAIGLGPAGTMRSTNRWQRLCRRLLIRALNDLHEGQIVLHDADGTWTLGATTPAYPLRAVLTIHDPAFYPATLLEQSVGTGRAFMNGWWTSDDVVALIRILARNEAALRRWSAPALGILAPGHRLALWARRNDRSGARRNIAAHYDLGDDFFRTFLDPSLTYSCAVFTDEQRDLAAAQTAKLDRICQKLDLGPDHHVLEIGTGWGSFAVHAARTYGCRVTTTTLSASQARHARRWVERLGLEDRVTVLEEDYRDLDGRYDRLVSIEMIEAVGTRFYPAYFRQCSQLLRDDGAMLLQAIVVDDRHFAHDARHVDFIKRYIFPGGVLPSVSVIADTVARATDLQMAHLEDLAAHYAETLRIWRQRLLDARDQLHEQGRDEAFQRCWEFYFAYCEGGFRERRVGTVQALLAKPHCRSLPLLQPVAVPWSHKTKEARAS